MLDTYAEVKRLCTLVTSTEKDNYAERKKWAEVEAGAFHLHKEWDSIAIYINNVEEDKRKNTFIILVYHNRNLIELYKKIS